MGLYSLYLLHDSMIMAENVGTEFLTGLRLDGAVLET